MIKGLMFQQQEENMSNLTSASGEAASVSSVNRNETGTRYSQQHFDPQGLAHQAQTQPAAKKKRNLPGNPDPDAEVIALSPKTLMTTNRFVCEICGKGFPRDQNLQLHRRGHNLPWKLKQRTSKEIKKKVYVCPESSCVHHDPSRALGDLTGIKKHFCRKHGEKRWKCDKCSKRYAVQSDWKAHSKTCGTREYRCDCGTLFSRRDSFITHRAFCDALAEESARTITGEHNPLILSAHRGSSSAQIPHLNGKDIQALSSLKKEQQSFGLRQELPPWLACPSGGMEAGPGPGPGHQQTPFDLTSSSTASILSTRFAQDFTQTHQDLSSNPNPSHGPTPPQYHSAPSPQMSATALLQKAAQMGATMNKTTGLIRPHHHQQKQEQAHVSANSDNVTNTTGFVLNFSSSNELSNSGLFVPSLASFGNKLAPPVVPPGACTWAPSSGALLQKMMNSLSYANSGFEGTSFEDAFVGEALNSTRGGAFSDTLPKATDKNSNVAGGGNEDLTRDFLGLRPLTHSDMLSSMAGLGNSVSHNTSYEQYNHSPKPWKG